MSKRIIILFSTLLILLTCFGGVFAGNTEPVTVYFFWGDGCPHCAEEHPYLEEKVAEYEGKLQVKDYELWYHEENGVLLGKFGEAYGFEPDGIPVTFVGNQYLIGFSDEKRPLLEEMIANAVENGCNDAMAIANGEIALDAPVQAIQHVINVPFIGEVDLEHHSAALVTVIIGLVDGVNPCSLWVLTMLLAMIVHTDSRKKTLIIGFVYIFMTAAIYALFILGVFTLLDYVRYIRWIQAVVALITLVMGLINLKDYFFFKEGVSLTIDDAKKPGLYKKMRNVVKSSGNIWAMIGATIVLSAGVSLVEFSCTAAFPVVWSNILTQQGVSGAQFVLLLLLYMFLYQFDELVIFIIAVITMKSKRMEEKHGRILKLFSGCLMVILSVVMLWKPALMNDLPNTILVFCIAVIVTLLVLLLTSVILPKFGIYIGHKKE